MYTKFILLVALFLFLIPATVSKGSTSPTPSSQSKSVANQNITSPDQKHADDVTLLAVEWPSHLVSNHHNSQPNDDDCKSHFFHFNRLRRKRYARIIALVTKLILLVTHVCSLFVGFVHIYHK